MSIKINKTHYRKYGSKLTNNVYNHLFWEIELIEPVTESNEFQQRLINDNIWEAGAASQGALRLTYKSGSDAALDHLVTIPGQHRDMCIRCALDGDNSDYAKTRWYRGVEYYINDPTVRTITTIYRDRAGFRMGVHLDNSHVMLQAIINLTENETGTDMYALDSEEPVYTMTGKRNHGIMFFNGPGALHGIRNVNKDRYILYYGICI